jgi:hypothetical protein
MKLAKRAITAEFGQRCGNDMYKDFGCDGGNLGVIIVIFSHRVSIFIFNIYILILRRLTPSVHLLANSKGNHVTGKKPLAAA